MAKLPVKDHLFWLNFFQSLFVFLGFWVLCSYTYGSSESGFNFESGYIYASAIAIIALCGHTAFHFSRGKEILVFIQM